MPLQLLQFKPKIIKDTTEYTAGKNGPFWVDCNLVRFQDGFPAKMGGWEKDLIKGINPAGNPNDTEATPHGVGRKMLFWRALSDSKDRIILGTHNHLYVIQDGILYDITPLRASVDNLSNPLTTVDESAIVTVAHTSHGAKDGDWIVMESATATNGIAADDLNRKSGYQITYVDANSYRITAPNDATSSGTGGGTSLDVRYLIGADAGLGTQSATPALGWGTSTWSDSTWGTPRSVSTTSVVMENSLWHISLWGEDILAGVRNYALYFWDTSGGAGSRSVLISSLGGASNVPTKARTSIVSFPDRHYVCGGVNTLGSSTIDEMLVRWSDQEDYTDWTPTSTNTSGDQRLQVGNKIVSMISTREETLISTDQAIYGMTFVGAPFTFSFRLLATNSEAAGINTMVDVDGTVYWMGNNNFYKYDGAVKEIPCPIQLYIFNRIDETYKEKTVCGHNKKYKEIIWFYPSKNKRYTLNIGASSNITPVTLGLPYCGITWPTPGSQSWEVGDAVWIAKNTSGDSIFNKFSKNGSSARAFITKITDQNNIEVEIDPVNYVNDQEVIITGTGEWAYITKQVTIESSVNDKRAAINSITTLTDSSHPENDNYVCYNYEQDVWTFGNLGRSCWLDSFGSRTKPFAFDKDGILYDHETGTTANGSAMNAYIESSPQELTSSGNEVQLIDRIVPDVNIGDSTSLNLYLKASKSPFSLPSSGGVRTGDVSVKGPLVVSYNNTGSLSSTERVSTRARGRQISLKIQSKGTDDQWALGTFRVNTKQDGLR